MVLLELDPPARLQVAPHFVYQQLPVLYSDSDGARVNVVELVVEDPGRGHVVDDELDVGRHDTGLDGREVDSYHASVGVRFGEFDDPGAGAAAYV